MRLTKVLLEVCGLLVLLSSFNAAFGQEGRGSALFLIWDERGKYGFIDAGGRVIIKPQFDGALPFTEGLAAVSLGKRWGFIDSSGKVIVPLRYYAVSPFSDGLSAVTVENGTSSRQCGYIDRAGQYVIKPQSEFACRDFKEGFALVGVYSETWHEMLDGYINKQGELALGGPYVRADPFSEGLARVIGNETSLFINDRGETVINLKGYAGRDGSGDEYVPEGSFSEGLAEVGIKNSARYGYSRYGFTDRKGRVAFELPESIRGVSAFRNGRAMVFQERSERVRLDMGGGEVITQNVDVSAYGYIDKTGRIVIPARFSDAEDFSDGMAAVKTGQPRPSNRRDLKGSAAESSFKDDDGIWSCINLAGRVVIRRCGEPLADKELAERFPKFGNGFGKGFSNGLYFSKTYVGGKRTGEESRAVYGYMNKSGRYIWIQPSGKGVVPPVWWLDNYR